MCTLISKAVIGRCLNTSDTSSQPPGVHRIQWPSLETSNSLQHSHSLPQGAASTVTWCHTGNCFAPPKIKLLGHHIHMIFTLVSEFTLLWNSSWPPVLVTHNPAQLNLLPHKKRTGGGRDVPRALRQQKQNLWPHPLPTSRFPRVCNEPCAPSAASQQDWLYLSGKSKAARHKNY